MKYLMFMGSILFLIGLILTSIPLLISEKSLFDREKESPFECGFDPITPNRLPFSLRFFIIAVIFLIFDVEIVLLLPMSAVSYIESLNHWLFIYLMFLLILFIGTLYEWNLGALYWKL